MKKQILIVGIIVIIITLGLTGCVDTNTKKGGENSKFVGNWIGTEKIPDKGVIEISMTFFSNGSFNLSSGEGITKAYINGNWEINHGLLVMWGLYGKRNYYYSFSNDDKSLVITSSKDDEEFFLIKQ